MGILLVYDVTDEASFNNIRNWMRNIEQHASDNVNKVEAPVSYSCHRDEQAGPTGGCLATPLVVITADVEAVPGTHHGCAVCAGPCGEQV